MSFRGVYERHDLGSSARAPVQGVLVGCLRDARRHTNVVRLRPERELPRVQLDGPARLRPALTRPGKEIDAVREGHGLMLGADDDPRSVGVVLR